MLKSCDNGKAQGKSTTGRALLWLGSSPKTNKLKPSLAMTTIHKLLSRTTFPYFFDDIRDQKLLCKLLEARFDDQQTYTNSKECVPSLFMLLLIDHCRQSMCPEPRSSVQRTTWIAK